MANKMPVPAPTLEVSTAAIAAAATEAVRLQRAVAGDRPRNGKAASILRGRGHKNAAEVLEARVCPEGQKAALVAALRDREVPGWIRYYRIRPLVERLDEQEAAERLRRFLGEVGKAADLLERPGRAHDAQVALQRASQVRFEGHLMAAVERLLWQDRLPEECGPFAEAVALAKAAPFGRRASALLKALASPLWEKVSRAVAAERDETWLSAQRRGADNSRSGFSGRHTGKTARRRALRAERRRDREEE